MKPNYELIGVIIVLMTFWGWIAYVISWSAR